MKRIALVLLLGAAAFTASLQAQQQAKSADSDLHNRGGRSSHPESRTRSGGESAAEHSRG
jgi:hypothetical protein